MDNFELNYQNKKFLLVSTSFWLVIAISFYFQDIIATKLNGQTNDLLFTSAFATGWVIWAVITPFVVEIAKKNPYDKNRLFRSVFKYLLIALLVAVVHLILEALALLGIITLFFPNRQVPEYLPQYLLLNFHVHIIIFFLIVGIVQASNYYTRLRNNEIHTLHLKNELIQSQLKALKMQIQPHFLFNTHKSIISLIYQKENEKAIQMLSGLSDLLRMTLQREDENIVTLKDELDFTDIYLGIQQIRFNNRLKVVKKIAPVDLGLQIPAFILQPIIENALQHGMEKYSDAGTVSICVSKNHQMVNISVTDDGAGLDMQDFKEGIGLSNIRKRLSEIYRDNYELTLLNNEPHGTKVELKIPISYE